MMELGVRLFFDNISPLPKVSTAAAADKVNGRMSRFTGKGMVAGHIDDAGFMDVVQQIGVVIRNEGDVPCLISVTGSRQGAKEEDAEPEPEVGGPLQKPLLR
jgi:hypothetical protein